MLNTRKSFIRLTGTVLGLLAFAAHSASAQRLPPFPPIERAYPYNVRDLGAISSLGNVPVGCINSNALFYGTRRDASTNFNQRAFWISGSTSGDLFYQVGTNSWVNGCNNNLVVAGTRAGCASVWDINWSGVQFLPDENNSLAAFAGMPTSEAMGVNSGRQVVGYVTTSFAEWLWTKATLWITSTQPNNPTVSRIELGDGVARAINSAGQIAGTSTVFGGNPRATVWANDAAHTRRTLFTTTSAAFDINTSGQTVGSVITDANLQRGFVAAANGSTTLLNPFLPSIVNSTVYTACTAWAINDGGTAVGQSWSANAGSQRATVWFGTTARNLNSGGVPPTTPTLTAAVDINNSGQILCEAWVNGVRRAYLLTPTGAPWSLW